MCREEKFMLYIILLFVFVVVYLMMLMRRQKEKMSEIKIQIDQAFRSSDEIEKICDEIWNHANTIHLYSSLAEEESKSITMKEKQKEIIRTTEEILNIIYKYKGNV